MIKCISCRISCWNLSHEFVVADCQVLRCLSWKCEWTRLGSQRGEDEDAMTPTQGHNLPRFFFLSRLNEKCEPSVIRFWSSSWGQVDWCNHWKNRNENADERRRQESGLYRPFHGRRGTQGSSTTSVAAVWFGLFLSSFSVFFKLTCCYKYPVFVYKGPSGRKKREPPRTTPSRSTHPNGCQLHRTKMVNWKPLSINQQQKWVKEAVFESNSTGREMQLYTFRCLCVGNE